MSDRRMPTRRIARFRQGNYVKARFRDKPTGESEEIWVEVESCNDEAGILFGKLDSGPLLGSAPRLGDELAVSNYDKAAGHRKASDFEKQ